MLFGFHIAKKLAQNSQHSFTKAITTLAVGAVSISIAVVLLSYGILFGFKKEIQEKVTGYAGHISVNMFDLSRGNEYQTLLLSDQVIEAIGSVEGVERVDPYLNKAGILKSDSVIQGLIFKGVGHSYDLSFYNKYLVRGKIPEYSETQDQYEILLSEMTADLLQVDTGDRIELFFIEKGEVKRRKPKVVGLFNTGLVTFDQQFGIAHIRMLQRVVGTNYDIASGYEVKIEDFNQLETLTNQIDDPDVIGISLKATHIKETYFTLFEWLEIVDSNVLIIIVLMFTVAIINIVTVLLILIIERIPMVGLFKALGSGNRKIMHIFSWQGLFILGVGLIIGNGLALSCGYLLTNKKMIPLPQETYYMDAVPFHLPIEYLIGLNILLIILTYLFTMVPLITVMGVKPARSIRFK